MTMLVVWLACTLLADTALAQDERRVETGSGGVRVEDMAGGLEHPWGMAFLPDGGLLVTERSGSLRILSAGGELSGPVPGTPDVFARDQGGLLDVAVDPEFASNGFVYLSFAEPGSGGASTALGRGRLRNGRIEGFDVLFRQQPKVSGSKHFGGRIVFAPGQRLFLTLGERFQSEPAQDVSNHLGAIVRIGRDGSIPDDNPFAGGHDAQPEIWSYGHRNVEAAALRPYTDVLWVAEMGPRGGDELNRIEAGRNYGWPRVSWGEHYDGRDIPDPPTEPQLADSVHQWTPVISPSGMIFYTGNLFPEWRGHALIGSLTTHSLVRVALHGDEVRHEERIALGARIRDVEQAPDGSIYVLTDEADGNVWRLTPAR